MLSITEHHIDNITIRSETSDLSSVFVHQLFSLINLIASRSKGVLIPAAYSAENMKSAWTGSVNRVQSNNFADHYATLSPVNAGIPRRATDRIPVEKKLPEKVGMQLVMGGMEAAPAEAGFVIRLNDGADGNAQYLIPDNALLSSIFVDAIIQASPPLSRPTL